MVGSTWDTSPSTMISPSAACKWGGCLLRSIRLSPKMPKMRSVFLLDSFGSFDDHLAPSRHAPTLAVTLRQLPYLEQELVQTIPQVAKSDKLTSCPGVAGTGALALRGVWPR